MRNCAARVACSCAHPRLQGGQPNPMCHIHIALNEPSPRLPHDLTWTWSSRSHRTAAAAAAVSCALLHRASGSGAGGGGPGREVIGSASLIVH